MVRNVSVRGLFCAFLGRFSGPLRGAAAASVLAAGAGCKNATNPSVARTGPDSHAPLVLVFPGHDTTVDSTGTLLVRVFANDESWITDFRFFVLGSSFNFGAIEPDTNEVDGLFPIPLAQFHGTSFKMFGQATDILGQRGSSDTITVSVR